MSANPVRTKLLTVGIPGVAIAAAPIFVVGLTMMFAPAAATNNAEPTATAVAAATITDPHRNCEADSKPTVSPPATGESESPSGHSRAGGNPENPPPALDSRLRGNDEIASPPVLPPIDDDEEPVKPTEPTASAGRSVPPPPKSSWTPQQLQQSLLRVPEVWLQPPEYLAIPKLGRATLRSHPVFAVIDARPDLQGLPMRRDRSVWLPGSEADAFRDASVIIRKSLGELAGQGPPRNRRIVVQPQVLSARPEVVARVMHQMLQIENASLRQVLLLQLKKIKAPATTRALAHQAVYEPVPELRKLAVNALAARPASEYMPVLLAAFRSPWPPAADHAADALTTLAPPEAPPELVQCLESMESTAPQVNKKGEPVVQELVRINHSRNCLLCHAQSVDRSDGIRVAVPNRYRPLPSPYSLDGYEGGGRGGSRSGSDTVFTRPDVTYMQQDFSWMLPVENPGPWPSLQRFDFVVRTRPASSTDSAPSELRSQQKAAIVRALRAITGKDHGERAADWQAALRVVAN
jgi:hypothetical protein